MKEMTLKEIQELSLEIMDDIHEFCIVNDIKYSLAYGTLLGAIRHHGFIPWDDDIDIFMTRPNWEKFVKTFTSSRGYKLLSPYDKDNYQIFARVCDMENSLVISPAPSCKYNIGLWIDILPIDGLPENIEDFPFNKVVKTRERLLKLRFLKLSRKGLLANIKKIIKIVIYNLCFGSINQIIDRFEKLSKTITFGSTNLCANLCCTDAIKKRKIEVLSTDDFQSYHLTSFEGRDYYIADGYDSILKTIFDDYMQLPPKEKQVKHHSQTKYYLLGDN